MECSVYASVIKYRECKIIDRSAFITALSTRAIDYIFACTARDKYEETWKGVRDLEGEQLDGIAASESDEYYDHDSKAGEVQKSAIPLVF